MSETNERFLQKMKSLDRMAALDADYDFHAVYVTLSANKELEKIIAELKQKLKRLDLYYFDKIKDATLSYEEHNQIIKALQSQDLSLALNAVEDNWKNSFARFTL